MRMPIHLVRLLADVLPHERTIEPAREADGWDDYTSCFTCVVPLPLGTDLDYLTTPSFSAGKMHRAWRRDGLSPYNRYGELCV